MREFDINNDGKITMEELEMKKVMVEIQKEKSQRKMAWSAIGFMIAYALLPILPFISDERLSTISSMSDMLFLSMASIVGLFFGAQAYMSKK
jgi:hypothetical protein